MYFGDKKWWRKKEKHSLQDKSYKLCKIRCNCLHQSFIHVLS